jgi:tape measure domain-containing protein
MATEVATLLFEADTRPLKAANDELAKTERAGVRAQDAARKMGTDLKKAANDSIGPLQKVSSGVSALTSALIALGGAIGIGAFVAYTDQWTDLNSRIINATGSAEAADEALQAISQTARTTYSSLQQTAEAFLLNSMALNELGYTTRQQVEFADALNNALVISGTKGERAASVMNALSKALALGKLSGDNFNSVIQSGGRVVQALADGLGVTTSELRTMAADGLLTTGVLIETLTGQMQTLRTEAEEMPATIGDAMVQLGNFALEAVGRLDEAAGLSASIAETIIASLAGWRAAYMPTEQQRFNELLEERVILEEKLQSAAVGQGSTLQSVMQKRIDAINAEMMALSDANVERQKAESAAVAAGQEQRAIAEQQRITDHKAELDRIETEKQARIAAEREARAMTRAIKMGGEAGGIGGITEEVERKRAEQEELLRMTRDWQAQMETEGNEAEQRKIDARAQQTQQLLAFEDVLLKGKSDSSKEAYRIGVSLMDAEKRQTAQKILSDSYAAAMAAWKSLSGIPFIGPALGAAAAGGILAAGVSYSAKSLAGRALGGQVRGGESYVVGERGPEVLTMGSSGGKIIPNSALSSAQATGTINRTANVTFQITANDARGFDQMLNSSRGKIIDIINLALNDNGREAIA